MREELMKYSNKNIIYADNDYIIISERDNLKIFSDTGVIKAKFKLSLREYLVLKNNLLSRLFRLHIDYIERIGKFNFVIIAFKKVFLLNLEQREIKLRDTIVGSRPLGVCFDNENIFYGEYINNKNRDHINIYKSNKHDLRFTVALTLQGIRHIHGIYYDKYEKCYWITTGDEYNECKIIKWNGEKEIVILKQGGQKYRAIDLIITPEYLYYGMDSPKEQNFIRRVSKKDSKEIQIGSVNNSVFYACNKNGAFFFSTVCEPSQINDKRFSYLYKYENSELTLHSKYKKDIFPSKLFQYGQLKFINCKFDDIIIIKPFSVKKKNKVIIIPV